MAFEVADGGGLIPSASAAAILTRMMAETSKDGGQGQCVAQGGDGFLHALGFDLAEHQRDVQVEWTDTMTRGQTITDMVAEQQFQGCASRGMDLVGLAFDDHTRLNTCSAGGNEPWLARGLNLDQADEAGGEGAALVQVTKGRNLHTQAASDVQEGFVGLCLGRARVEGERDEAHETSMA
jgi:hypothetical protein